MLKEFGDGYLLLLKVCEGGVCTSVWDSVDKDLSNKGTAAASGSEKSAGLRASS